MRTSGGGSRDVFMLSVPLAILVFFVIAASGGVTPFLRRIEHNLVGLVDWVRTLFA